ALDFLAAGQTLTITYNVTVTDNNGVSSTRPVTITVIGTNDAPVITSAQTGAVTEHTNVDNSGNLNTGGTVTFTDVDLTDKHTVTFKPDGNNYPGTFTPTLTHDATGGSTGSVGWTFSVPDKAVEFLAAGQTLTQTYTVLVADNNGGFTTQDVTITITGTDDAPVIATADKAETGSLTELANTTGSSALDPTPAAGGTIHFTDVDLTDRPDATIATQTVTAVRADGTTPLTLTAAEASAIKAAFTIAAEAGNTNNGAIDWSYQITDSSLDFLAVGEKVTLVSTVQVDDHHGGTDTATVTITITGSDDTPGIASA